MLANSCRLGLIALTAIACLLSIGSKPCWGRPERKRRAASAHWWRAETENFRVYSYGTRNLDERVLRECETRRAQIAKTWFAGQDLSCWTPKCDLVLHPTLASYRTAAGPPGDCTVACCTIDTPADGMALRRIDVCAARGDWLDHLPHELTHLLVDCRLTTGDLPRWADEGMALLADPVEKRAAHARDLSRALEGGSQFRLVDLLSMDQYPRDGQVATFYGQSMAIVKFLVDRGGTEKFAEFVNQACQRGYDVALSTSYGIDSVGELEKQWLAQARTGLAERTPASVEIGKSRNLPDGSAPGQSTGALRRRFAAAYGSGR
jgi:hypothetical protein